MKRLLNLLVVVSMLLILAPATMAAEPVTVEVWDMQQSNKDILEAQQKAIAQFEQENPGIKMKVTVFPYAEYRDKLLIAVQGGTPPDISTLDQIWMAQWAASDAIIPLDDYLAKSTLKRDDFFPGAWDSNVWGGKVWGIPQNNDVWQELYYNKDLFKAAGLDPEKPPANWDELLDYASKLNKPPDQYGIAIMGMGEMIVCIMDSFIRSNGGDIINPEGTKAVINSPEAVAALKYLKDLDAFAPPGTASRNESDAVALFTTGKVAMILAGSWQQDSFKGAEGLNWGVAMTPAPAGKIFHGTLGGWNLAVYKASKHPDEAWKYVEFLGANKEVQKTVNSLIPARLDAGKEFIEELRLGPQVIFDTVNNGLPRPLSKVYFDVSKAQVDMMQEIWAGGDVQKAADNAAMVIDEALASE
jgi:multiple sugar transport system substrate-binding protein